MIKLVFALRRLPQLSRDEFQRYWLDTHGPLVLSHAETLRIKRYVQVHTTDTPVNDVIQASRDAPDAYDGVAELWFDSIEDAMAGASSPEGAAAAQELLEDERKFIDHARSPLWLAAEHELVR